MADKAIKRTQYAQQGLDFTTLFSAKFNRLTISGYQPVLREPPAESTGGGAQAVQHMVFQPTGSGPTLTVGSVNVATRMAKLRTFDCVQSMFSMRFANRPFVLEKEAYQDFFDKAREFFQRQGMQIDIETRPPDDLVRSLRPSAAPPASSNLLLYMLVATVLVVGVALVVSVLTGRLSF